MRDLCTRLGEANVFCGDPRRQVADTVSVGGDGRIVVINSLDERARHASRNRRPGRRHDQH